MAHILNWITCGIKMMSLHYGWGWRPPQTICSIHMKHVQNSSSLTQLNQSSMAQILGFWVTSGVKMMSLRHGWGWQPTQTIYCIHMRHIQSVWAHWYAVHWHMVKALHSAYNTTTWLKCWGTGSLVESKRCHYVMVEADGHPKLFIASIWNIYKVFQQFLMLAIDIRYQP